MPDFLTVRELADLLRVKERKIYDLAAKGAVPCSKVTGKLLFPEDEIRAWIAAGAASAPAPFETATDRPAVLLGSHDPLLDWAVRQSQCGLASFLGGSGDGLDRFARGEGVIAGLHLRDETGDGWNIASVARIAPPGAVLLRGFTRARGLLLRPDSTITGLAGLDGARVVPRQEGSGTATLLDALLAEAGVAPSRIDWQDTAFNEADAALAVQQGSADATLGLASLAETHGLRFLPLLEERFDLLVCRRAYFDPGLQTLFGFLRSESFAAQAARQPGYAIAGLGEVLWNA
ncbi:substrate-binding domain-containing protein [Litorisediminicola beolgyonensis]|uniref:Substrate-binding domain-containing protein n=1 Tax=Litorisediminicola beolgyonensis TaxID=1173614 RepID=A0ABW3ZNR2_9RHOB